MKAGKLDEAERLYELARKDDPFHTKWIAGLARVHLRQKDNAKFLDRPGHDRRQRRRRPRRPQGPGRAAPRRRPARPRPRSGPRSACYIDVYDPADHVLLADALAAGKKYAAGDRGVPDRPRAEGQEARTTSRSSWPGPSSASASATPPGRRSTSVLKADPEHPEAKELREEIGSGEERVIFHQRQAGPDGREGWRHGRHRLINRTRRTLDRFSKIGPDKGIRPGKIHSMEGFR